MKLDEDKIDDAALALLRLTLHDERPHWQQHSRRTRPSPSRRRMVCSTSRRSVAFAVYVREQRALTRRGGRVVEGTGLENRQAGDRLEGSNPSPSATACSEEFLEDPESCLFTGAYPQ